MIELLQSQLTDVFRIGLIIALIATTIRTQGQTGRIIPLIAGVIFVAVIIPSTMQPNSEIPMIERIGMGILANAIILGACWGIWQSIQRGRGK
jgi:chromate transport protein ChrA